MVTVFKIFAQTEEYNDKKSYASYTTKKHFKDTNHQQTIRAKNFIKTVGTSMQFQSFDNDMIIWLIK